MEQIKLSGIIRDPRNDTNGACQEIINLRYKDSSWVPVGKKVVRTPNGVPNVSIIFVHNVDPDTDTPNATQGKNYLGYNNTTGQVITWELATPSQTTVLATLDSLKAEYLSFIALKNIVVIIDRKDNKLHYFIWKDSQYTYLSQKFPELVRLSFYAYGIEHNEVYRAVSADSFMAAYSTTLAEWRKTGYDEGYAIIRYAYELYDGSVVCHSAPQLICLDPQIRHIETEIVAMDKAYGFRLKMYGGKPNFLIPDVAAVGSQNYGIFQDLLGEYRDIVKNVVFYMSKPIPSNKVREMGYDANMNFRTGLTNGTPFSEVAGQEVLYKIGTVSTSDLWGKGLFPGNIQIEAGDLNNYEGRDILPQDNLTHYDISGGASMVYNGRLLLGNITTKLFDGYRPEVFFGQLPTDIITPYYIDLYVTISTEEGSKYVCSQGTTEYERKHLAVPALISYPDIRASQIDVVKRQGLVNHLVATYSLSPKPQHNVAQLLLQADIDHPVTLDCLPTAGLQGYDKPDLTKKLFSDRNMCKASELNNPFVFPSKYTYLVGVSDILAFETNALPISTGQFGQYPVFVFTNAGMWSMQIGGGDVFIQSIVPLNDLICNNPKSITKASGIIVFSTEEGLVALTGGSDALLSQPLRGSHALPLTGNNEFFLYCNHDQLVSMADSMSETDFNSYLKDPITGSMAHVGYDHKNRELIISNYSHNYSYVYSFVNNVWTKITETFKYFIKDYPNTYGVVLGNNIVDITAEDNSDVDCLVVTRPVNYNRFVKIVRLGMKATIDMAGDKIFGMYMFGSVDGRKWQFITGIQKTGDFNNPYVNRSLMSFQEAIIIIAGKVRSTTYLRDILVDVKAKYSNKEIR